MAELNCEECGSRTFFLGAERTLTMLNTTCTGCGFKVTFGINSVTPETTEG